MPSRPRLRGKRADAWCIGRYRVLREVGAGSMGRVYAALDPDLGREIALKVLRPTAHDETTSPRARLAREARAMARLAHPNVITVHEIGAAGDQLFIAMELVKRGHDTLDHRRAPDRSVFGEDRGRAASGHDPESRAIHLEVVARRFSCVIHRRAVSCGRRLKCRSARALWRYFFDI